MKRCLTGIIFFTTFVSMMNGCALYEPNHREPEKDLFPSAFTTPASQWEPARRWWEAFDDPQLNELIEEALGQNFSLQQSWARLHQAQALAVRSGASLYPDLTLGAGASSERRRTTTTETVEHYSLGLSSGYEIDLWGRIRSERQAALLSAMASRQDLNTAAITLSANVATRWIGLISQRMQKKLLMQQLEANQVLQELVELRFRKSLASALDVFQQRQLVEQSRAQLPLVEQAERQLLNELALLLGRTPFSLPQIKAQYIEIPNDLPQTGLPVQLLADRPDIRGAMQRLEAADWNVAAARADRMPQINLSAGAAYQANELSLLFDNWLIDLAASMTAPLFDGRRRAAEVQRLQAVVAENLAAYRQTILTAIREVEDALVSEIKLREHLKGLEAQLDAARKALDEARGRYRNGLSDYLPVVTQLLAVQSLERTQIQRRADVMTARVNLYRSLGGTWTDALIERAGRWGATN
jgi:multidrug efflux system outer membrane protein